jgi:hypothetical protein
VVGSLRRGVATTQPPLNLFLSYGIIHSINDSL